MSLVGRQLGDFVLDKKLGAGGMGEVYKAKQISLDRTVAVKVLPKSLAAQAGFEERFRREARAAANLIHPNVMQVYHIGIDPEIGTPYFAMEFVDGEDLQQRVKRLGRLPFADGIEILTGVTSALACASEKGIVHRDVKPSNIMIDKNEIVKVMDFGLAKVTQDDGAAHNLTQSGLILGTPNYISPEAGKGDPIDGRSDIYSLGVVMYELLTGQLPFTASTPAAIIYKHVYEPPPKPRSVAADIPPFLEEICLRMIAKDPKDRYPNAKALLVDLHDFKRNAEHYLAGGARRTPYIGGSITGSPTLGISGEFPGRPGAGSRSPAEVERFRAAGTAGDSGAISRAPSQGSATASMTPAPGVGTPVPGSMTVTIPVGKRALLMGGVLGLLVVVILAVIVGSRFGGNRSGSSGGFGGSQVLFHASKLEPLLTRAKAEAFFQRGLDRSPLPLNDTPVDPGSYTLSFEREGFEPLQQTFMVGKDGEKPPLDELKLDFKPKPRTREMVEDAKRKIEDKRYSEALTLLQPIVDHAPDYADAVEAHKRARDAEEDLRRAFQTATDFYDKRQYAEAIEALKKVPPTYDRYDNVTSLIQNVSASQDLLKTAQQSFEKDFAEGSFSSAGVTLEQIGKLSPKGDAAVGELRRKLGEATGQWEEAQARFKARDFNGALEKVEALLKAVPKHHDAIQLEQDAKTEVQKRKGASDQIVDAVNAALKYNKEGQYARAVAEASRALQLDPANKQAQSLLGEARTKLAEAEIARALEGLDREWKTLSFGSREKRSYPLLEMCEPATAEKLKAEVEAFMSSPIEIIESTHGSPVVTLDGERASVQCTWSVTLGFPEADGAVPPARGRRTALAIRQKIGLSRAGEGWRFASFEEQGSANVR